MERAGFQAYQRDHKSNSGQRNSNATVREQDRYMPIANVIRIMRKVLPSHAKISDDAKETIQECVSEYISFITSEANERCQREQRKTVTAEDLLWAMSKLGFDDYVEPLAVYLQRYRESDGDTRGSMRLEQLPRRGTVMGPPGSVIYGSALPPGHQNGLLGGGMMGGYFRDGAGASSSGQVTLASFDPYESQHG